MSRKTLEIIFTPGLPSIKIKNVDPKECAAMTANLKQYMRDYQLTGTDLFVRIDGEYKQGEAVDTYSFFAGDVRQIRTYERDENEIVPLL